MDLSEVLRNFLLISDVDEEESDVYMPLLKDALRNIKLKLKNKSVKGEDKLRLNYATAVLAFYKYMLLKRAKNIEGSFSAGGVNIKSDLDASVKAAEDIWIGAKEDIADLLLDDNFYFQGIPSFKYCC